MTVLPIIIQMFNRAKRGLQSINAKSKAASDQEKKVAKNVTSSLAMSLQDLSVNFRKSQSSYLKREYCIIDAPPTYYPAHLFFRPQAS